MIKKSTGSYHPTWMFPPSPSSTYTRRVKVAKATSPMNIPHEIANALTLLIESTGFEVGWYGAGSADFRVYLDGRPAQPSLLHVKVPGQENRPACFYVTMHDDVVVHIDAGDLPNKQMPNAQFDLNDPQSCDQIVAFLKKHKPRYQSPALAPWIFLLYVFAVLLAVWLLLMAHAVIP